MNPRTISVSAAPILVTGGLGFIGGHLVDKLADDGFENIRVLDNSRRAVTPTDRWPSRRVKVIAGDIRILEDVLEAVAGCQVVFHLAAQSNVLGAINDPTYSCATNVGGTLNVLVAARDSGVKRVVFTSSREIYGDPERLPVPESAKLHPKNLYGASKAAGEMYSQAFASESLQVTVLRLANVYGARDRDRVIPLFVNAALRDEPLTIYGGDQVLDFVSVDTVVAALLRVGMGAYVPGPINIGSGTGTTISELAKRVLDLVPCSSRRVVLPSRAVEVNQFVADLTEAKGALGLMSPGDPLADLPAVVQGIQNEATLKR